LRKGVHLDGSRYRCCTTCGHVWATLNAEELREFLLAYGDELAKQDAGLVGGEQTETAPDVPQAWEAAQRVAEIDGLVRAEKRNEAARRYRELTAGTWDQAIDAVRGWRDLNRGQKPSLFGWSPKEAPTGDQRASHDHPMRDTLLDG
jgi:hypothetical protein